MKIMHLRSSEFYGGPERAIVGQCIHLTNVESISASFVGTGSKSEFLNKCKEEKIKTAEVLDSFPGDIRVASRLKQMLLDNSIDLLVTHDYKSNFFGYFACKKIKTIQATHFRGRTNENFKVKFYNALDNYMLKKIDNIMVVSEASKQLLTNMGIQKEKIFVIENAFDITKINSKSSDNNDDKFDKTKNIVSIISAGRLSHEKGFDILLNAIAKLKISDIKIKFSIYGEGPEKRNLQNQAEKLEISDAVSFCGFSSNLLDIYGTMDFLVLPSRSEGMPNVVLEAWSQKLGVVAASVGGLPEMITDMENGLLAIANDSGDLAKKIEFAVNNLDQMKRFGERGQKLLFEKYNFQQQADKLSKYYQSILDKN